MYKSIPTPNNQELKKFGLIMFIGILTLSLIPLYKNRIHTFLPMISVSVFFLFASFTFAPILVYIYKPWMILGGVLGWINTRIILILLYYVILTPIAIIARLARVRFLNLTFDPTAKTYWTAKENTKNNIVRHYTRQF